MNRTPTMQTSARSGSRSEAETPLLNAANRRRTAPAGFTLVELLTSMAILGVMLALLFSVFDQINKAWLIGENRVETFTAARAALDLMSRELTQAMATPNISFYGDAQQVNFVAPVNTNPQNLSDLCEVGYWFEQVDPGNPNNLTMKIARHFIEPSTTANANLIYNPTWWSGFVSAPPDEVAALASNCVVTLQFQYYKQDGTLISPLPYRGFKLPYKIVINLGVVDSRTATKLALLPSGAIVGSTKWQAITNSTLQVFSTTVYLPDALP